jgi:hypothetical protein
MNRTTTTPIFPLLALLSVAGTALAENRIVFLAGSRSHGPGKHEFNAGCQLLAKALNEQSGLDVKAEVIPGWPSDPAVLDGAKAVVIYSDATSVVGKGWERIDALTKKSVGVMSMHNAVHPSAQDGDKYFRPWIGGAFETGWSVNPHWVADLQGLPNPRRRNGSPGGCTRFSPKTEVPAECLRMRMRKPLAFRDFQKALPAPSAPSREPPESLRSLSSLQ